MLHGFELALMFLAGTGLGIFFFGGLAWTVRRWSSGSGPMLVAGSFLLRSAVVLVGFWLLARDQAGGWIACLLGFTAARLALQKTVPARYWLKRGEGEDASHH